MGRHDIVIRHDESGENAPDELWSAPTQQGDHHDTMNWPGKCPSPDPRCQRWAKAALAQASARRGYSVTARAARCEGLAGLWRLHRNARALRNSDDWELNYERANCQLATRFLGGLLSGFKRTHEDKTVKRLPVVPVRNNGTTARRKPTTRKRHPCVKEGVRPLQQGIQTNTPPPLVRIRGANSNHWYQMPVHPLARQVTTSTASNQQTEATSKNKTGVRKKGRSRLPTSSIHTHWLMQGWSMPAGTKEVEDAFHVLRSRS